MEYSPTDTTLKSRFGCEPPIQSLHSDVTISRSVNSSAPSHKPYRLSPIPPDTNRGLRNLLLKVPRSKEEDTTSAASLLVFPSSSCPPSTASLAELTVQSADLRNSVEGDHHAMNQFSNNEAISSTRTHKIFFFVNPTSGRNSASGFTAPGINYVELLLDKPHSASVWIYDIREGASGQKPGFLTLRRVVRRLALCDIDATIFVIVAGGDGTIMWCVSEIWAHDIDDSKLAIGVVPYGTGNDFARVVGWHHLKAFKPFDSQLMPLRHLVQKWIDAAVSFHDVWEVDIGLHANGCIKKIDNQTRRKKILTQAGSGGVDVGIRHITFNMLNYFSLGVESRIGIGFDRHRTNFRVLNKLRYGAEGVKKTLFKKTPKVHDLVAKMSSREGCVGEDVIFRTEASSLLPTKSSKNASHSEADTQAATLYRVEERNGTPASSDLEQMATDHPVLLPCVSLIALNIPSFGSGMDPWSASENRLGQTVPPAKSNDKRLTELKTAKQKLGDGLIEFLTFGSTPSLGVERAIHGFGRRVHQGRGPFRIDFHPGLPLGVKTYFQVDGEFFIMTAPDFVKIRWLRRIRVLTNACADPTKTSLVPTAAHRRSSRETLQELDDEDYPSASFTASFTASVNAGASDSANPSASANVNPSAKPSASANANPSASDSAKPSASDSANPSASANANPSASAKSRASDSAKPSASECQT